MAGKKTRNEIDSLRTEIQSLSEAVWALRDHVSVQRAATAAGASRGESRRRNMPEDLKDVASLDAGDGVIATRGSYLDTTGARAYRWDLERSADALLAIDDDTVAQTLAAIGHRQRLAILKTLIGSPASASDLVEKLGLGTTGAAYHHLNVLQAADLVDQEQRGTFVVRPHRVSAVFAILAGVESAADATYADVDAGDNTKASSGSGKKKRKAA